MPEALGSSLALGKQTKNPQEVNEVNRKGEN
jgi:hypothetical protein